MNILLNTNEQYNLDHVPNEIEDLRYCILDCGDKKNIDYYFVPLIFLESFTSPAVVLKLGDYTVEMPLDWSIMVCDESLYNAEVVPLTHINDRGFKTLVYNPLKHMVPFPVEIEIINIFSDVQWFVPKIRNNSMLVVPLENRPTPVCGLFIKEIKKISSVFDLGHLF